MTTTNGNVRMDLGFQLAWAKPIQVCVHSEGSSQTKKQKISLERVSATLKTQDCEYTGHKGDKICMYIWSIIGHG